MRREFQCKACGADVIADDDAQSIAHAEPVCAAFEKRANAVTEPPEIRRVNRSAIAAHFDAIAARVRRRRS